MIVELSEDKKFLVIKECTQEEYEQVVASYTKMVDGYRFNPLYKKGLWDGSIKFMKGGNIPSGTYYYLKETMKTYGYELKINGLKNLFDNEITIESFTEWVNDFFKDSKYTPRDYQIESAFKILKYKRCLSELATSAGKTLICFMVIAYLLDNKIINGKVLMIVPIVDLVMQSAGDFEDYSTDRLPLNIQEIYSGFKLRQHTNIMVGTYQSLVKLEPEFYKQFDCVITDECLHPSTTIIMSDGTKKQIKDVKQGDFVYTYNEKTKEKEIKEVEYVYKNLSKHDFLYEIELEDGSIIKLTGNHKVLLTNGLYKRVDELAVNDDIMEY